MIRVRQRAKRAVALLAIAGMAVALAACGDRSRTPEKTAEKTTEQLIVPTNLTPPVAVSIVKGAPEQWDLRNRVAAALRERDIPATISSGGQSAYTLKGKARPSPDGKNGEVSLVWELFDPDGNKAGEIIQLAAVPDTSWLQIKGPDLDAVAEAAAESIAPIVPSAALGGTQFATKGGKVEQRTRVDDETAARKLIREKGAGPLQKRLAGMAGVRGEEVRKEAERKEELRAKRKAQRELDRKQAEAPEPPKTPEKPRELSEARPKPKTTPQKPVVAKAPTKKRRIVDPKEAARIAMAADPSKVLANPGGSSRVAAGAGGAAKARAAKAVPKSAASRAAGKSIIARKPPQSASTASTARAKAAPVKKVREIAIRRPGAKQVIDPGAAGELRGQTTARRKLPPQTASTGVPQRDNTEPEFYWVQVGAYGDKGTARKIYADMRRKSPENLGAVPHVIVRGSIGTTPVYRVRIGPFPSRGSAGTRCKRLKSDGIDCFLKRTG